MQDDNKYQHPVDHPKIAAVAGFLYDKLIEPINRLVDWVSISYTRAWIRRHSDKRDL